MYIDIYIYINMQTYRIQYTCINHRYIKDRNRYEHEFEYEHRYEGEYQYEVEFMCIYSICMLICTYHISKSQWNHQLPSSFIFFCEIFPPPKNPRDLPDRIHPPAVPKVRQVAHAAHRNRNFLNRPGNPWFKPKGVGLTKKNRQDTKTLRDPGENRPL